MIADAIRQARKLHREVIEQTYDGKCTVRVKKKIKKEYGSTGFLEEVILANQPCRLIFKSISATGEAQPVATETQGITLLLSPEVEIPSGAKVTVIQNGNTGDYSRSGVPAVYSSHQEVSLKLFERYV